MTAYTISDFPNTPVLMLSGPFTALLACTLGAPALLSLAPAAPLDDECPLGCVGQDMPLLIDNGPPHPNIFITLLPQDITPGTGEFDAEFNCTPCTPCEQQVDLVIQTALNVGVALKVGDEPVAIIRGFYQKNEKITASCGKTGGILVIELTGEPDVLDEYSVYHSMNCSNCDN